MANFSPLAGGLRNESQAVVSTDQRTILGDGTASNLLRAGVGNVTFLADGRRGGAGADQVRVGQTVVATSTPPDVGITAIRLASATFSGGSTSSLAQAIGIVVENDEEDASVVQSSGIVTLAEEVWDSVTGQSGGLTPGDAYYLSNLLGGLGKPTSTPPTDSGTFLVQVGVAINATALLLSSPAVPRFNP